LSWDVGVAIRQRTKKQPSTRAVGLRSNDAGPEWRLARRGPIIAYDDYLDTEVELKLGQKDPGNIAGLVIDFRYIRRDHEVSRRSLLCWHCGRDGEKIYVRGYCPFREELRTFRIDRMSDVIAFLGGRETPIGDVRSFFAAFAAGETEESKISTLSLPEG
jgi:WYL domain